MNLKEYQTISARTAPTDLSDADRRENAAMMIVGEFGELLDILKKHRFQGHELDRDALRGEFGDVMWGISECFTIEGWTMDARTIYEATPSPIVVAYIVAGIAVDLVGLGCGADRGRLMDLSGDLVQLIEAHGFTLYEVLEHNVAKLARRYPDGFSVEASINRATT